MWADYKSGSPQSDLELKECQGYIISCVLPLPYVAAFKSGAPQSNLELEESPSYHSAATSISGSPQSDLELGEYQSYILSWCCHFHMWAAFKSGAPQSNQELEESLNARAKSYHGAATAMWADFKSGSPHRDISKNSDRGGRSH